MSRWVLISGALLLGQGCIATRAVGFSPESLADGASGTSVCLKQKAGGSVDFTEGQVQGRSVIHLDGIVIGLSPTLELTREVDGMAVYAGQECLDRGPPWFCDNVFAVKKGPWRTFVHSNAFYTAPDQLPADAGALLDAQKDARLLELLAEIDPDDATLEAIAALGEARQTGMYVRLGALVAGAALMTAGAAGAGSGFVDAGKGTFQAGVAAGDLVSAVEELPLLQSRPKLVPVLRLLSTLGPIGVVCLAKVPSGGPS